MNLVARYLMQEAKRERLKEVIQLTETDVLETLTTGQREIEELIRTGQWEEINNTLHRMQAALRLPERNILPDIDIDFQRRPQRELFQFETPYISASASAVRFIQRQEEMNRHMTNIRSSLTPLGFDYSPVEI